MNFITDEIKKITTKFFKNENKNILYYSKLTKFKKEKFYKNKSSTDIYANLKHNKSINNEKIKISGIKDKWLTNFREICRYISFIT